MQECKLKKSIYLKQPSRKTCKICDFKINKLDFYISNIGYSICEHLNGEFEDTEVFTNFLYKDESGKKYNTSILMKKIIIKE